MDSDIGVGEYTGAKALMLAILQDAVRRYCGPSGRLQADAEYWLVAKNRSVFSFTTVCETLGLDPDAVRARLATMRRAAVGPTPLRRVRPNVRRVGSTRPLGTVRKRVRTLRPRA